MSAAVSFITPGLIDPRCITTMGVSVKETENPIGYFGTGLKYAIAILLRAGGKVTIWRGMEPLRFEPHGVSIRGAEVDLIAMNGADLGFTTQLGKNWKMWQAFREIYCNTVDENGKAQSGVASPCADSTTIVVEHDEFAMCLHNIGRYVLRPRLVSAGSGVEYHEGPTDAIFYRSIRVADVQSARLARFAVNLLLPIELTEDRTIKNAWESMVAIAGGVLRSEDPDFIESFITTEPTYHEHELGLDWPSVTPSAVFLEVARRVTSDPSRTVNKSVREILARCKSEPELSLAEMLPSERRNVARAIEFCRSLKYPVDEFPIEVVEGLGADVLGKADRKARKICIAKRAIQMGDLMLASTLIEEWAHIKHGLNDCSRGMQNWLFEQITRLGQAYLETQP